MMTNLFSDVPAELPEELVETLVKSENIRVERIVSTGHTSPHGFWYDQEEHEWVLLLAGQARLLFEDDTRPLEMNPGDCINISAGRRHRVEWTSRENPTIWLAVFYGKDPGK